MKLLSSNIRSITTRGSREPKCCGKKSAGCSPISGSVKPPCPQPPSGSLCASRAACSSSAAIGLAKEPGCVADTSATACRASRVTRSASAGPHRTAAATNIAFRDPNNGPRKPLARELMKVARAAGSVGSWESARMSASNDVPRLSIISSIDTSGFLKRKEPPIRTFRLAQGQILSRVYRFSLHVASFMASWLCYDVERAFV